MRKKGNESSDWREVPQSGDKKITEKESPTGKRWVDYIDFDNMVPLMPRLKKARGAKCKVQLWTFDTLRIDRQEIFDKTKGEFSYLTQIDVMAHYIGMRILQEVFVVRRGFKKSRISQLIETWEKDFMRFDEMKLVRESCDYVLEQFIDGIILEDECKVRLKALINCIPIEADRKKMAEMIDKEIGETDLQRIKDRIRKRKYRTLSLVAKESE
jgi:hypothetical protein